MHRGLVRPEVLRSAYAHYHTLIHTSRHEPQGMALIEAAVIGLPVATTKVGVAEDLVALGATVELAEAKATSLADSVRRAAVRAGAGRDAVLARYGIDACTERYLRCFEEAVSDRAARSSW